MALIDYVTRIQLEFGAVRLLAQECGRAGIRAPLVVTDKGVRAAGVLRQALDALPGLPLAVFDAVPSNPTDAAVRAAADAYRTQRCDGLVAVGGGSAIDCAKGVAIAVTHEGPLARYATVEGGSERISGDVAPVVAVPTTAGTGSEAASGAIIIVADGRKLGFHSRLLVPRAAICDPELTLDLPPALTAATGLDAIAHCMEAFMSAAVNPPADGIALDGLARGWASLEAAYRNGHDREARFNMMSASLEGALARQKGLGCVHALSHAVAAIDPQMHHGALNSVFLPAVIRFNAYAESILKDRRIERMAHAMGLHSANDVADEVRDMAARLGLPMTLRELGVQREWFPRIVQGARADHCHQTNPRRATEADYLDMLEASM